MLQTCMILLQNCKKINTSLCFTLMNMTTLVQHKLCCNTYQYMQQSRKHKDISCTKLAASHNRNILHITPKKIQQNFCFTVCILTGNSFARKTPNYNENRCIKLPHLALIVSINTKKALDILSQLRPIVQ